MPVASARRHVARLEELSIPVESVRGRAGGYRLRPGWKLPPLMLDDDEAVAIVLGLAAARRARLATGAHRPAEGSAGDPEAGQFREAGVDRALAKLRRVLPPTLARVPWRWQVEVVLDAPLDELRRQLPAHAAELEALPEGGVLLRARADRLDGMARLLTGLGARFTVRTPTSSAPSCAPSPSA